ncbi:MAG TPA: type II toxin-antitoxin system RelE/ParE family toxin [Thermoanaerobaculia bacterium]|nr:type II toxin-antitoxin system RelE/ParE family toxin [Thermoanaerobaculia bacterium]
MARYEVRIKRSAVREIEAIPRKADRRRILERIGFLAADPRPPAAQKLTGQERYRLRQGPYRILYSIEDKVLTVFIVLVAHRSEAYRRP